MTDRPRDFRIVLAVSLLLSFSLWSIGKQAISLISAEPLNVGRSPGHLREFLESDRYADLLEVLPDDVTAVAYIDRHSVSRYSWAQYVLAPLLVVDTTDYDYYSGEPQIDFADYDYVIGEFEDPPAEEFLADNNLVVEQEFDDGVYLLRTVAP